MHDDTKQIPPTPRRPGSRLGVALGVTTVVLLAAVPSARAAGARSSPQAAEVSPQVANLTTVEGYVSAWVEAVRGYDVDRWASLVDEDVVMMAPSGRVIEGRQAFRELWSNSFEGRTGVNPLQVSVLDSRVTGTTAMLRADYGPEGADPVGQYVWMLERDGAGRWSMVWWIFNGKTEQ